MLFLLQELEKEKSAIVMLRVVQGQEIKLHT